MSVEINLSHRSFVEKKIAVTLILLIDLTSLEILSYVQIVLKRLYIYIYKNFRLDKYVGWNNSYDNLKES